MAVLTSFGDNETSALPSSLSSSLSSSAATTSATAAPAAAAATAKRSREFWRFLCELDEESLLVEGLSLDKLAEMKRILERCLSNVNEVIKQQNSG